MRLPLLCLAAASLALPALAQQTPPRTNPPSQASGQQPGGLGTTGEGGVTRGSQGPGSGAGMNSSGGTMGSPGQTTGGATAWTSEPTRPQRTTPDVPDEGAGVGVAVKPPAGYANPGDWSRHVRACQARYRSYNAATDSYRTYSGRTVRCRL